MGFLVSVTLGFSASILFAAILSWLDRYEKEPPLLLVGVFLWGVIIAAGSAFVINTLSSMIIYLVTGSEAATELTSGSIIAPLVEEVLKGLGVLVVFLIFRREFDSVLDGLIYAGVTALGFAATENSYYIYTYGYSEGGWGGLFFLTFIRIILVGWQHPFYTAFTGIGLAVARNNSNWFVKILAPLAGLSLAIFTHASHNTIAGLIPGYSGLIFGTFIDWTGWLFMFAVILWATWREQQLLRMHLWPEVTNRVISQNHYQTAISAWKQLSVMLSAMFGGSYMKTRRFYQVCGELAHKKQQLTTLGDEQGNQAIVQNLRRELAMLDPYAQA